jgi:hypothetical protein
MSKTFWHIFTPSGFHYRRTPGWFIEGHQETTKTRRFKRRATSKADIWQEFESVMASLANAYGKGGK